MRQPLVIANWKMNGLTQANNAWVETFSSLEKVSCDVVVCAPHVYLSTLSQSQSFELGAQDVNEHESGAYTGEISAAMLSDLAVKWCIVGHSERRQYYGDTNERIAQKVMSLVKAGIRPILCVGETLEERDAGQTLDVVAKQLLSVLSYVPVRELGAVAYEPIWAIGTGKTATPQSAQEVHRALREIVKNIDPEAADALRLLYGGSVKPNNALELFSMPDIDGGLIGGAALNAQDFHSICQASLTK